MKKIQLIVNDYMVNSCSKEFAEYMQISTITYPKSFDDYETNIFFLISHDFFELQNARFKYEKEYENISKMIANCNKTTFIFILPNNITLNNSCRIIDHPDYVIRVLDNICETKKLSIYYENTNSQIQGQSFRSCFVFNDNNNYQPLTFSTSNKVTTVKDNDKNMYYTTLNIQKQDAILEFMKILKILKINSDIPKWLNDYSFYDDEEQHKKINEFKRQIIELENNVNESNAKLEENLKYKKVLIATGDELVDIVFEMLEDMFDISLNSFEDEKKEDFLFEKEKYSYVGEIKGVNESVKRKHVAQASSHCADYCDELDEQELEQKSIKTLLIINYQRKTEVDKRDDIDKEVIKYAQKQDVLIIDSQTFLTLYEHIKRDAKCKKKIINLINKSTGLLSINGLNL